MLRWKSSLKPAAAAPPSGGTNPGTSNLVAWLGMEEGSGNSVDDSTSNNNDFTLTNGSWVTGKVGNYAVRLDGTGDYLSSDSALTIGSKICTVSFWMYWTKVGAGEKYLYELGNRWWQTDGSITLKWDQANTRFLVAMQDSTSGTKYLEVAFPEPSDGQWVYVTVVYNGTANSNAGEIKLYYDGTEQSSSSVLTNNKDQASNFTSSTLFIGANSTGSEEITADLDTFAIFSDELTQDEITWMYNSGSGRSYFDVGGTSDYKATVLADNPLFYYRLGEASSATTAYDEVATTNNGTYYGSPTLGQTGAISGDSNTSVLFKGQSDADYLDAVNLPTQSSLLPATVEFFFKETSGSNGWAGMVFFRNPHAGGVNKRGNDLKLGYHWDGDHWQFTDGPTYSLDTWYYAALVVTSTAATLYLIAEDGTLTSGTNTDTHDSLDCDTGHWKVGREQLGSNRFFKGNIDEVALYDQALSQSRIEAHAIAAGFTSSSYVLVQNFDTSGTPTDFTVSQGSVDFNATPPTLSYQGGGTLHTTDRYNNATISQATKYAYYQIYVDSYGEGSTNIFTIKTLDSDYRVRAKFYSTGVVRFEHPSGGVDLTKKYIAGAWYHFWLSYNPSTGFASLEFNATGTPSGSGDGYANLTLATTSSSLSQIEINGRRSANMYMDRVLLSNSTIGGQATFSQDDVVISQLDVTQDSGGVDTNNEPVTFDAVNETYATGSDHSRAITVSKVEVYLKKTGNPTGELSCYLYEPSSAGSEGVPDDRVGTADAALSMSSISTSDYAWYTFTFTGQSELTAGNWLKVVLTASDGTGLDGSNYIQWAGDNFLSGSWAQDQRTTGVPGATDDSSNWTVDDGNACFYIKVYQSP